MPIQTDTFFLDRTRMVPLQDQLRAQIIRGVSEGRFRAGEKLPSSRKLAEHLRVARVTVGQAFAELVATGYLTSRDRSGHFVSDRIEKPPLPSEWKRRGASFDWEGHLDGRFSRSQRTDRMPDWRRYRYCFVYGQADPELVNHVAWRNCAMRALGQREFAYMTGDQYSADDPELIDYIADQLLPRRGIRAQPEEIVLTMGAQNGLWIAAEILLGRGGRCAIENPCYPGLREILAQTRAEVVPVEVDGHGLPPEAITPGMRAVFTTASHQCPTNTTMAMARRKMLLQLAQARGMAVIEDDYEFEMSFVGAPSPALKAMDETGSVIYIGSFSKSVFPGLRLGYIVADPRFIREARALRAMVLRHPPGVLQRALAHFLALGYYDAQMCHMRRSYANRRAVMVEAMAQCGLVLPANHTVGGSSLWLPAPPGVDSDKLASALREREVLIEPGAPFFDQAQRGARFYRLAYSSIPTRLIPEGIARIAQAVTAHSGQGGPLHQAP